MEFITKANYLLELIDVCKNSKDVEAFYATLKTKEEQKQKVITKLNVVLEFLDKNSVSQVTILGLPSGLLREESGSNEQPYEEIID